MEFVFIYGVIIGLIFGLSIGFIIGKLLEGRRAKGYLAKRYRLRNAYISFVERDLNKE